MSRIDPNRIARRRRRLRRPLLVLAVTLFATAVGGGTRAQNYPWCSNFADGAGTNCGFATEEQCRVTIQGSGGYCDRNTQFRPTAAAPARHDGRKPRPDKHS